MVRAVVDAVAAAAAVAAFQRARIVAMERVTTVLVV
jgi:hypothetical protein